MGNLERDIEVLTDKLEPKTLALMNGFTSDAIPLDYTGDVLKLVYLTKELIKAKKPIAAIVQN